LYFLFETNKDAIIGQEIRPISKGHTILPFPSLRSHRRQQLSPVFFVVALCFVLMLCAHALGFVLYAPCSLCAYRGFWSPLAKHEARSTKHAHVADGQQQKADAPAHKNWVFLSRTAKHKAQSMSTKQPIMTKRCDFEHKARTTKHKAQSMSTKQRPKNWAQGAVSKQQRRFFFVTATASSTVSSTANSTDTRIR
jgi:hypothetical protein